MLLAQSLVEILYFFFISNFEFLKFTFVQFFSILQLNSDLLDYLCTFRILYL